MGGWGNREQLLCSLDRCMADLPAYLLRKSAICRIQAKLVPVKSVASAGDSKLMCHLYACNNCNTKKPPMLTASWKAAQDMRHSISHASSKLLAPMQHRRTPASSLI